MSTPRSRTPSTDVERSIIDAAENLLIEEGPDALTVRRIAAVAGVAPMGVYNHLGGKDGVLDALLVRGFDGLHAVMGEVGSDDPYEDLAEVGRRYRRFAREHPRHYALMFERSVPDHEPSRVALVHAAGAFAVLERLVRRALDSGDLAPGVPADIAQQLWSACHGMASLELHGMDNSTDLAACQEATSAALLRGLRGSERIS